MADNFLERHRRDYEERKAAWLRRKRLGHAALRKKCSSSFASSSASSSAASAYSSATSPSISKPDDEAL